MATAAGEGEGNVAFFSANCWDRRNRADLIESVTPCHDAQVVGPYRDSNPLRLTVLAAMSEDCTTVPQHLHMSNFPVWILPSTISLWATCHCKMMLYSHFSWVDLM